MQKAIDANIKYLPDRRSGVVRDYRSGIGVLRLSKIHKIPKSSVRAILRLENVKFRGPLTDEEHRLQSGKHFETAQLMNSETGHPKQDRPLV